MRSRCAKIPLGQGVDELRNFIFNRTSFAALRYFAVEAAFCFGNRLSQSKIGIVHDFFMERSNSVLHIRHEETHLSGNYYRLIVSVNITNKKMVRPR